MNSETIRLGGIGLSFHRVTAAVVRRVLESEGHQVEYAEAPHEELFSRHAAGELDVLVSAWLPSSHQIYLDRYTEAPVVLPPLYHPYCIWAVPPYVPEDAVAEVADLLDPDVAERMEPLLQGIGPGAGISRFSAKMIEEYGLGEAGYFFRPGSEEDCYGTVHRRMRAQSWFVVPLWRPQYLNLEYGLRAIREPKGLLGTQDDASVLVSAEAEERLGDATMDRLRELRLGNDAVERLDRDVNLGGLTPAQAAEAHFA